MKTRFPCLALAALTMAACDKAGEKAGPADPSPTQNRAETPADTPKAVESPAPAPGATTDGQPPGAPPTQPADPAPANESSEPVTAEQQIARYKSGGMPGMPRHVSDKILADAALTESNDDQLNIINRQAAAWIHINTFREGDHPIPGHMRRMLLERLAEKHGDSWIDIVPELDEQIAASARVDELRANGIPGLSADESHELIIRAMEKYGPDYKAILSVAEQAARK